MDYFGFDREEIAELARKAASFRKGTKRIYDGQGDRADMWYFELWNFLGEVQFALSKSPAPHQSAGELVAWRWRHGCRPWLYADEKPDGPSINLFEVQPLYATLSVVHEKAKGPDLRPPSPDFRVVPVRVLQSAYDRIDAMLAGVEPDLRAANSVRIELRHLVNESYALSSRHSGGQT